MHSSGRHIYRGVACKRARPSLASRDSSSDGAAHKWSPRTAAEHLGQSPAHARVQPLQACASAWVLGLIHGAALRVWRPCHQVLMKRPARPELPARRQVADNLVEVIALILLPVAVLMCAYALTVFVWRSRAIAKKTVRPTCRAGPCAHSCRWAPCLGASAPRARVDACLWC